jgi:aerobic carbon-monoxide dehydrogenase large subunit
MGSIGALSNAISDALSPFGVVAEQQPFTPERLRSCLAKAQSGAPSQHQPAAQAV